MSDFAKIDTDFYYVDGTKICVFLRKENNELYFSDLGETIRIIKDCDYQLPELSQILPFFGASFINGCFIKKLNNITTDIYLFIQLLIVISFLSKNKS